jgi:hypothetical protein
VVVGLKLEPRLMRIEESLVSKRRLRCYRRERLRKFKWRFFFVGIYSKFAIKEAISLSVELTLVKNFLLLFLLLAFCPPSAFLLSKLSILEYVVEISFNTSNSSLQVTIFFYSCASFTP